MSNANVKGRALICPICGGNDFEEGSAQLNTAGLTFLGLDWANRSADTYKCTNCNYILWFDNN